MQKRLPLLIFAFFLPLLVFSQDNLLKLWYNKPAGTVWESALPIGNGRLAAMVYGNPVDELIRVNEATVWSGSPNRNDNPDALAALPEIRKLIFDGKFTEASKLAAQNIQSRRNNGMNYQPVGDLKLTFSGHQNFKNFYRELDLSTATTTTSYTINGVKYTRVAFVSVPCQVMVIRLTANKPNSISFTAGMTSPQKSTVSTKLGNTLVLNGISGNKEGVEGKVKFQSLVQVKVNGGMVTSTDTQLDVKQASDVTLYISIATNFISYNNISADEGKRAEVYLIN
ncbi:MAG: glycoside hydrolase family 95 protein, partial [Sphingobacteriaceae bacterium]